MKKLLAMLLAALMLVCVGAAALADASITFQMGGEPECMDPTINDYSSGSYALQSLFRGLYKYDADGALVPRKKTFEGWTAELVQHMIDHCKGKLV